MGCFRAARPFPALGCAGILFLTTGTKNDVSPPARKFAFYEKSCNYLLLQSISMKFTDPWVAIFRPPQPPYLQRVAGFSPRKHAFPS